MKTTKRRGRGESSIYQRADGRWTGSISLGYDAAGKRVRRDVYGATKAEAATKLRALQVERDAGRLVVREDITVAEYLRSWLAGAAESVQAGTHERYRQLAEDYLVPAIGAAKLSRLSALHIRTALAKLERTKGGKVFAATLATKRAAGTVLTIALNEAVELGMITANPAARVKRPRPPAKEMQCYTPEQAQAFLAAASASRNYALFAVAVGSGCRLGAGNATAGLRVLCDEVLGPGGRALLERLGDGDLAAGLRKILSENR